jgi:hypothetical protein
VDLIDNAMLLQAAGALAIALISYRLGLASQSAAARREVIDELRPILLHERDVCTPNCAGLSAAQIDRLLRLTSPLSRRSLRSALEEYGAAKHQRHQDKVGQSFYADPKAVEAAINRLLTLIE